MPIMFNSLNINLEIVKWYTKSAIAENMYHFKLLIFMAKNF